MKFAAKFVGIWSTAFLVIFSAVVAIFYGISEVGGAFGLDVDDWLGAAIVVGITGAIPSAALLTLMLTLRQSQSGGREPF